MSDLLCVCTPSTWPADLQDWGQKVAKTVPYVDPVPQPPAGYFTDTELDRYYLREAVVAARRYWSQN
jgi:hypothetical protein